MSNQLPITDDALKEPALRFEMPDLKAQRPGTCRIVFLWRPRIINGYVVWLEYVDRWLECDRLAPTNCGYRYETLNASNPC